MSAPGVVIKIAAETKQAVAAIKDVDKSLGGMSGGQKFAAGMKAMQGPALAALGAVAAGAGVAVAAASELEQAQGSLDAVFKTSAGQMTEYAKAAADLGLSQADYSQNAALLGAQLANTGMAQDALAGSTDELINRAADMAAQFGGSTTDAVGALSAMLRGEYDSLEQYGLSMKQSDVAARAAADGISEAEAKMRILNEQLGQTGTIGAAEREMGTFASQTQQAQANLENAAAAIGEALLPIVADLADRLSGLAEWVAENSQLVLILGGVLAGLAGFVLLVNGALAIWSAIQVVLNAVLAANPIVLIVLAIIALIAIIVIAYKKVGWFRDAIDAMWRGIKAAAEFVWDGLKAYFEAYVGAIKTVFGVISGVVEGAWDIIKRVIDWIADKIKWVVDKLKALTDNPLLGVLGNVVGFSTAISPTTGYGPRSFTGGGSVTYNIHGALDPEGTARAIQRLSRQSARRNGWRPT